MPIKDVSFLNELLPSSLYIITGKAKTLDSLGFVRQIHDSNFILPDIFDWITKKDWQESYSLFRDKLVKEIMTKDKITQDKAELAVKKAFWSHLQKQLTKGFEREYNQLHNKKNKITKFYQNFRLKLASNLPFFKKLYRTKLKPFKTGKKYLHYEVLEPSSKYYNDFKPIIKSFSS